MDGGAISVGFVESVEVDEKGCGDEGVEFTEGEPEKFLRKAVKESLCVLEGAAKMPPELDHGEGIDAGEVEGAEGLFKDFAAEIDVGDAVGTAEHRAVFVDEAAPVAKEGTGGLVVFGHLSPLFVRHVVEGIGMREAGPLGLQFRQTLSGLFEDEGLSLLRKECKSDLEEPGIEEGDVEEPTAASGASCCAVHQFSGASTGLIEPCVDGAEQGLVFVQNLVHRGLGPGRGGMYASTPFLQEVRGMCQSLQVG